MNATLKGYDAVKKSKLKISKVDVDRIIHQLVLDRVREHTVIEQKINETISNFCTIGNVSSLMDTNSTLKKIA